MADDETNDAEPEGNGKLDAQAEIAAGILECKIAVEAVLMGARTLASRHAAQPIKAELELLVRLLDQVGEAFEALAVKIDEAFGLGAQADA